MKPIYTSFIIFLSGFQLSLTAQLNSSYPVSVVYTDITSNIQTMGRWNPAGKENELKISPFHKNSFTNKSATQFTPSFFIPETNHGFMQGKTDDVIYSSGKMNIAFALAKTDVDDVTILFRVPLKKIRFL